MIFIVNQFRKTVLTNISPRDILLNTLNLRYVWQSYSAETESSLGDGGVQVGPGGTPGLTLHRSHVTWVIVTRGQRKVTFPWQFFVTVAVGSIWNGMKVKFYF